MATIHYIFILYSVLYSNTYIVHCTFVYRIHYTLYTVHSHTLSILFNGISSNPYNVRVSARRTLYAVHMITFTIKDVL